MNEHDEVIILSVSYWVRVGQENEYSTQNLRVSEAHDFLCHSYKKQCVCVRECECEKLYTVIQENACAPISLTEEDLHSDDVTGTLSLII